jgi:hypothetical protein
MTTAAIMHPKPSVDVPPTMADLAEHGPAACLAALREEFTSAHARYPQYRGWTEGTTLGVARQQIGGHGTFTRAEAGDLVLVKRDRWRPWIGCASHDVAYVPRVGWNVSIAYTQVDDLPA